MIRPVACLAFVSFPFPGDEIEQESYNPGQKSWDSEQAHPSPTYNFDNRVIFSLSVGRNAIFSNIDWGDGVFWEHPLLRLFDEYIFRVSTLFLLNFSCYRKNCWAFQSCFSFFIFCYALSIFLAEMAFLLWVWTNSATCVPLLWLSHILMLSVSNYWTGGVDTYLRCWLILSDMFTKCSHW